MFGCTFKVTGKNFDVDAFGAESTLVPEVVYRRGRPFGNAGNRCHYSGFSVRVSTVFGRLAPQIRDAIKFLGRNVRELERLSRFSGATDRRLVFPYCPSDVACASELLPSHLLAKAGSLGIAIEISVYPSINAEKAYPNSLETGQSPHDAALRKAFLRGLKKRVAAGQGWSRPPSPAGPPSTWLSKRSVRP